ncbi:MAG: hypothetical protein ACFFD4_08185 [Candidatus Odinarchaeota archaeon]
MITLATKTGIINSIQAIVQETEPEILGLLDVIKNYPFQTAIAAILAMLGGFLTFYLIVGRKNIPLWLINAMFVGAIVIIFFLTVTVDPWLVDLFQNNPGEFFLGLIFTSVFGIFFIPFVITTIAGYAIARSRL